MDRFICYSKGLYCQAASFFDSQLWRLQRSANDDDDDYEDYGYNLKQQHNHNKYIFQLLNLLTFPYKQ